MKCQLGSRLKTLAKQEQLEKELIREGIMLVREKVSSTILIDTLKGFIDKKEQSKLDSRYFEEGKLEEVING